MIVKTGCETDGSFHSTISSTPGPVHSLAWAKPHNHVSSESSIVEMPGWEPPCALLPPASLQLERNITDAPHTKQQPRKGFSNHHLPMA